MPTIGGNPISTNGNLVLTCGNLMMDSGQGVLGMDGNDMELFPKCVPMISQSYIDQSVVYMMKRGCDQMNAPKLVTLLRGIWQSDGYLLN